jgi:hypothetical protein
MRALKIHPVILFLRGANPLISCVTTRNLICLLILDFQCAPYLLDPHLVFVLSYTYSKLYVHFLRPLLFVWPPFLTYDTPLALLSGVPYKNNTGYLD